MDLYTARREAFEEKYGLTKYITHGTGTNEYRERIVPVLLDGKPTPPDQIDPVYHEFIGIFRPPIPEPGCSQEIEYQELFRGTFDRLSYITRKP